MPCRPALPGKVGPRRASGDLPEVTVRREESAMSRSQTILEYLIEQAFVPQQEGAWYDRHIGQAVIRVVCQPSEETELICLAPPGVCQYKISPRRVLNFDTAG